LVGWRGGWGMVGNLLSKNGGRSPADDCKAKKKGQNHLIKKEEFAQKIAEGWIGVPPKNGAK